MRATRNKLITSSPFILNNMRKTNKEKSNRGQGDYFELLVCQYICHLYQITFSYSENLAKISNQILERADGPARLKLQNDNFIKIQPEIKKILDEEIKKKGHIIGVVWTGRHFVIEQSTSDVDAVHYSQSKTRFSIKSIEKSGTGTLKTLGLKKLETFFNFKFSGQQDKMWQELEKYIFEKIGKEIKSRVGLKKAAKKNQKLLTWAKMNGKKYQYLLNNLCFESFNWLSLARRREFLNFITDCHDEDLYVIIVNNAGVVIYKPIEKQAKEDDKIIAKKVDGNDVGYTIYINNMPTYRVQTNNTNGIGISPFCQRIFLI